MTRLSCDVRKAGALMAASLFVFAIHATAATSQTGTSGADVGQLVEISVTDGSVATLTATPTSGQETVAYSTADALTFSNAKSNVQSLWDFGITAQFTKDSDSSTSTTSVSYQGTSSTLVDLVYLTQSASGKFTPWKLTTDTDLTAESTGWTKHADCTSVDYKGSLSVPAYDSTGSALSATTYYYNVCDSTEFYLGSTKDLSSGDKAFKYSSAQTGTDATAANFEVAIQGNKYVFYSAADASSVTLRQGVHVDLSTDSVSNNVYTLFKIPDGFPAGTFSATLTASATDIVS